MKTTLAVLAFPVAIALAFAAPDAQAIRLTGPFPHVYAPPPAEVRVWRIPEPVRPPGFPPLSYDDGPTPIPLHHSIVPRANSATPMPVVPLADAAELVPFNPRRADKTPAAPCPADPSSPHYLRSLALPCASFAPPNSFQLRRP